MLLRPQLAAAPIAAAIAHRRRRVSAPRSLADAEPNGSTHGADQQQRVRASRPITGTKPGGAAYSAGGNSHVQHHRRACDAASSATCCTSLPSSECARVVRRVAYRRSHALAAAPKLSTSDCDRRGASAHARTNAPRVAATDDGGSSARGEQPQRRFAACRQHDRVRHLPWQPVRHLQHGARGQRCARRRHPGRLQVGG